MSEQQTNTNPLEKMADLIDYLKDCATSEVGASDKLRERLSEAKEQAERDLDAQNLARRA